MANALHSVGVSRLIKRQSTVTGTLWIVSCLLVAVLFLRLASRSLQLGTLPERAKEDRLIEQILTTDKASQGLAPTPRHLIHFFKHKSHGFGLDLNQVAKALIEAGERGKQELQITWLGGSWMYADGACPSNDMRCFFEPPPKMNLDGDSSRNPKTIKEALHVLLKPLPETQQHVDNMPGLVPPLPLNEPCGVIHVRHADTTLNFGYLNRSSAPRHVALPLQKYVDVYRKEAANSLPHVVLLTDDQEVIDDLEQNYKSNASSWNLTFHYFHRKRFLGNEGGFENHFPSGSRAHELHTILKAREAVSRCRLWVGTRSRFASVLQDLMAVPPKKVELQNSVPFTNETLATRILQGLQEPPKYVSSTKNWQLRFRPGQLKDMNSTETLRHCFTNTTIYRKHFWRYRRELIWSKKHNLIYVQVPKSGSSTAKYMMENHFSSTNEFGSLRRPDAKISNSSLISFVRDPLSRFFAQYDETFATTGPWRDHWKNVKHPYPFFYEGMKEYSDYEDVYCPPNTRTSARECTYRKTQENGTLVSRFERFVNHEFNWLDPFDVHLLLQTPILSNEDTGQPYPILIYNTSDGTSQWKQIAQQHGVDMNAAGKGGLTVARSFPRRFDQSRVTDRTKQRICAMTLLDYCCLNLPLPPPCSDLFCTLNYDSTSKKLRIEPWTFPMEN